MREFANQNRDDQVREEHDQTTPEEQGTAANSVHGPERASHTDELDAIQHARHDELHVVLKAHGFEECRRVVYEGVDADELGEIGQNYADEHKGEIACLPAGRT